MARGIIYILTNPMYRDDVIKIGKTTNLEKRLKDLGRETGTPCPFECYTAYEMDNYEAVEKLMHTIYRELDMHTDKEHKKKEFFQVPAPKADSVLSQIAQILKGKQVNVDTNTVYTKEQQKILDANRAKKHVYDFADFEIPTGSKLTFIHDDKIKCTVQSAKGKTFVKYKNKQYSLSALTTELMNKRGHKGVAYNGYLYWLYDDTLLYDIRRPIKKRKK
ncbi:GIY-YIG nuclease family protein [bacterium]|nr:GIY-YIG nuclease family protein [bacterium]